MSLSAENRTFYLVETGEIGYGSSPLSECAVKLRRSRRRYQARTAKQS